MISSTIWGAELGNGAGLQSFGAGLTFPLDGTARTGCYYARANLADSAGVGQLRQPVSVDLLAGETYYGVARVWIRLTAPVSLDTRIILHLVDGITSFGLDVRLNINRTWSVKVSTLTTGTSVGLIPLNTWTMIEVALQFTRNTGRGGGSATINGETLATALTAGGAGLIGTGHFDRIDFGNQSPGSTTGSLDYDDVILMQGNDPAIVLPSADRIRLVPVTGQGAAAAWTGSYTAVQDVPVDSVGPAQTSSTAGAATIFQHQSGAQLGCASVTAYRTYASCHRASGSSTEAIRVGVVDTPVTITTSSSGQTAPSAVTWSPAGVPFTNQVFDAIEWGMVNVTGAALTLRAMSSEVLYDADAAAWFVCAGTRFPATGGLASDGSAPPFAQSPNAPLPGCLLELATGSDSGGGSGCQPSVATGSDSGGGSGCGVTL